MDAVSEILVARHGIDDLTPMWGVSAIAHGLVAAAIVMVPAAWMGMQVAREEPVMVVSLAGSIGPQTGGRLAESAQATQAVAPPQTRPQPVAPPTAKAPEMIEPTKAPPRRTPPPKVTQAPKDAPQRTAPSTGTQVQAGEALANTGAANRTPFGGTASGAGGTGARVDVGNFCCPQYLAQMQERILRNWESRQQALGTAVMVFSVQRDGTIADVAVEKSSGNQTLDFLATRALRLTQKVPPLPAEYTNPTLRVHLTFEYQR